MAEAMGQAQAGGDPADALWRLVCAFRQRAPAPKIVGLARGLSDDCQMCSSAQQALLDACLLGPATAALPPGKDYLR